MATSTDPAKYLLRVTAGPAYEPTTHVEVPVNTTGPTRIASDLIEADLNVRVHNYRGLPLSSPKSSPYFDADPHARNGDQYSICFSFRLKAPPGGADKVEVVQAPKGHDDDDDDGLAYGDDDAPAAAAASPRPAGVSAHDLQFGNDLDRPIRDRLPPGFNTALNIVKWWVDPGLEGDALADQPHLYGSALSSFNVLWVGQQHRADGGGGQHGPPVDEAKGGIWIDEGGHEEGEGGGKKTAADAPGGGDGVDKRAQVGMPAVAKDRMKWALRKEARDAWTWEYGRTYAVDFFNPYVDFDQFALRLPGFTLPVMKYWDGQGLRYVLRNRSTAEVYLVVLFTIHLKEDVNEDGSLMPRAFHVEHAKGHDEDAAHDDHDEEAVLKEAQKQFGTRPTSGPASGSAGKSEVETSLEDLD